jgi:hypothetical protein
VGPIAALAAGRAANHRSGDAKQLTRAILLRLDAGQVATLDAKKGSLRRASPVGETVVVSTASTRAGRVASEPPVGDNIR